MHVADEKNFIAVWPQGLDDTVIAGQQAFSWNSVGTVESPGPNGDTCKWVERGVANGYPCHTSCRSSRGCRDSYDAGSCDCATCADDILFVEVLLDELERTMCVDTNRVFLTGMSNGAMMVYQLAQSRIAARFAAIVPVSGSPLLGFGVAVRHSPLLFESCFLFFSRIFWPSSSPSAHTATSTATLITLRHVCDVHPLSQPSTVTPPIMQII
jgi:hypothetical protein